ncbi:MAG: hypothetical protein HY225_04290 [Candidatus Vogelbacteria bacterium]|nr:hypothetical protein [Candidatus Vogelbacteria bacterium]
MNHLKASTSWEVLNALEPLTNAQLKLKESLKINVMRAGHEMLTQLVKSPEAKDMLDGAAISMGTLSTKPEDSVELLLTKDGVCERFLCNGHKSYDMADCANWDYCPNRNKVRTIARERWPEIVEKFQIDKPKVDKVFELLNS